MNLLRLRLDTLQFVRGLPTWLGFAEKAEEKPPPDPYEQTRIERCRQLHDLNETIRVAWEEALRLKREGKIGW